MRNKVFHFLSLIAVSGLIAGCAGPTEKFSRGLNNTMEFARLGELRRSMEQASIFDTAGHGGVTDGVFTGINRSFARTGAGLYEVLTFPIPNGSYGDYRPVYHPRWAPTGDLVYPDSYKPDWLADPILSPDTSLGFAGGDIAPWIPGSRFRVFDN
jgi:putative exosortase-associated protein (TIGR04073 family)